MKYVADSGLVLAFLLVATKSVACILGLINQIRRGGRIAEELKSGLATQSDLDDYVAGSNAFDAALSRMEGGVRKTLFNAVFRSWFTITFGSLVVFAFSETGFAPLALAVGVATSLNAVMHLVTAVVRRMILGHHDSEASDVQVATFTKGWAVTEDPLGNLSVYFLVLVYFAIVGFAALDRSLQAFDPGAFAIGHLASTPVLWIYLSITTIATVGFGDIHPISVGAQIAVICQIATGPLLLSWLIAVFATQPTNGTSP